MEIGVDPVVEQRFERSLDRYREQIGLLNDTLRAARQEIARLRAQADAHYTARRGQLLAEVKQLSAPPTAEQQAWVRRGRWAPRSEAGASDNRVLSFQPKDEDYSQQRWMR